MTNSKTSTNLMIWNKVSEIRPSNGKDVLLLSHRSRTPVVGYYHAYLGTFCILTSDFKANIPPPNFIAAEWIHNIDTITHWTEIPELPQ